MKEKRLRRYSKSKLIPRGLYEDQPTYPADQPEN